MSGSECQSQKSNGITNQHEAMLLCYKAVSITLWPSAVVLSLDPPQAGRWQLL